jgi:hypothetical protein
VYLDSIQEDLELQVSSENVIGSRMMQDFQDSYAKDQEIYYQMCNNGPGPDSQNRTTVSQQGESRLENNSENVNLGKYDTDNSGYDQSGMLVSQFANRKFATGENCLDSQHEDLDSVQISNVSLKKRESGNYVAPMSGRQAKQNLEKTNPQDQIIQEDIIAEEEENSRLVYLDGDPHGQLLESYNSNGSGFIQEQQSRISETNSRSESTYNYQADYEKISQIDQAMGDQSSGTQNFNNTNNHMKKNMMKNRTKKTITTFNGSKDENSMFDYTNNETDQAEISFNKTGSKRMVPSSSNFATTNRDDFHRTHKDDSFQSEPNPTQPPPSQSITKRPNKIRSQTQNDQEPSKHDAPQEISSRDTEIARKLSDTDMISPLCPTVDGMVIENFGFDLSDLSLIKKHSSGRNPDECLSIVNECTFILFYFIF